MPSPVDGEATGGRLTGDAMQSYMECFADRFLKGRIRFRVEVKHISRNDDGKWCVEVDDGETHLFDKLVLCTGVSFCLYYYRYYPSTSLEGMQSTQYTSYSQPLGGSELWI